MKNQSTSQDPALVSNAAVPVSENCGHEKHEQAPIVAAPIQNPNAPVHSGPSETDPAGPGEGVDAAVPSASVHSIEPAASPAWTSRKEFSFTGSDDKLREADIKNVAEIATYMKQNPEMSLGIDGYLNPRDRGLSHRRINAVRGNLIKAGLPSDRIKTGAFGDSKLRRDGRVEILIRNPN